MARPNLTTTLLDLCVAAGGREQDVETVDSWLSDDTTGTAGRAVDALLADPVIAQAATPGTFLYLVTGGGVGYSPGHWLSGFIRHAETCDRPAWQTEAERFVKFLRVEGRTVPVEVRTTLAGVLLAGDQRIELPFGTLRPAHPADMAASNRLTEVPPGAVFEYETEIPAAVAAQDPFVGTAAAELRRQVEHEHDRRVARMLLALALVHDGPVQEHMVWRAPKYTGAGHGVNVPPLAPIVTEWPYFIEHGPRLDRLTETAALIADIPLDRLAVATRRYLLARAERVRPTDQIVDYVTAIESMTWGDHGGRAGRALATLITSSSDDAERVDENVRRLKNARNAIVHEGATPSDATDVARAGRDLVLRSIEALVRRELHGPPRHAAWGNLFHDAIPHVRDWDPRRWHPGATQTHSSQALCVSVFGTVACRRRRTAILQAVIDDAALAGLTVTAPKVVCEEVGHADLLGESGARTTPTSIDVLATWTGGVLTIESKFCERGFGACSQPRSGQCSGNFESGSDLKTGSAAPCRLMIWDGDRGPRNYWDIGQELFEPTAVTAPRRPCPFAGPSFQLMRNLAFAAALARRRRKPAEYGFLVAYVAASPNARAIRQEVDDFRALLRDEARSRVGMVSYERIAEILREHNESALADFVTARIASGLTAAPPLEPPT